MADTTNTSEPDILDQLTQENDPTAPSSTGASPESPGTDPNDPARNNEPAVEAPKLPEGVEIIDDMGNYNTRGLF